MPLLKMSDVIVAPFLSFPGNKLLLDLPIRENNRQINYFINLEQNLL